MILRKLNEGKALDQRGTRVGDKLQGLTGGRAGRLGLWAGDGTSDSTDKKTVEANQSSGFEDHRGSSHHGNGRYVNGVNGTLEWEEKWTNGAIKEQQDVGDGNPFEVLKVVSSAIKVPLRPY